MGRPGASQARRHSTHGRTATSAALRPIRQGGAATLSEGGASARTESGGDTKGGRLCADPPVDLRGVSVAAPARMLHRAHTAVGALVLAGTGAAVRALIGLYRTSLGYDPHNVIIASINLPENSYTKWADRAAFYERLRNRMADVPQVESVALATASGIPPQSGERSAVDVPGRGITGAETPIYQRIS